MKTKRNKLLSLLLTLVMLLGMLPATALAEGDPFEFYDESSSQLTSASIVEFTPGTTKIFTVKNVAGENISGELPITVEGNAEYTVSPVKFSGLNADASESFTITLSDSLPDGVYSAYVSVDGYPAFQVAYQQGSAIPIDAIKINKGIIPKLGTYIYNYVGFCDDALCRYFGNSVSWTENSSPVSAFLPQPDTTHACSFTLYADYGYVLKADFAAADVKIYEDNNGTTVITSGYTVDIVSVAADKKSANVKITFDPFAAPGTHYNASVRDGSANPTSAAAGTTISLTASAAPAGKVFDKWVQTDASWNPITPSTVTFTDATSQNTTFTMVGEPVYIRATYKLPPVPNAAIDASGVLTWDEYTGSSVDKYVVSSDTPNVTTVVLDTTDSRAVDLAERFSEVGTGTYPVTLKAVDSTNSTVAESILSYSHTDTTTVPDAPTELIATPGDKQVTLNWMAPANDGGREIRTYLYSVNGGAFQSCDSTATSYTVIGLTNNTSYTFKVRAYSTKGESADSNEVTATPVAATLTGAVTLDNTSPRYGDTITANYVPGNNSGALSYQWYSDSNPVGTNSNTYTVAASDIGKTIKCVVSSSVETGTVEGVADTLVNKALVAIDAVPKSVYVGDPMPVLTYTVTGLLNEDSLSFTPTMSCSTDNTAVAGTYGITPSGTYSDGNYSISYGNAQLKVLARPSGGGTSAPSRYAITTPAAEHGSVSLSKTSAKAGDTITITIKPDKGYTLETLTVTDKNGKEIKLTENADGTRSFKMPAGKVEVKATFMEDNTMLNFFVDVPVDSYYYDAVLWAAKEGITEGTSATDFSPNAPCTRAQVVTFLWRAAGCPEPENAASFSDVGADSYYTKAVAWAAEQGITGGNGPDTFSPNATCTRGQIAAFLYRFVGSPAVSGEDSFGDVAGDSYYADAVKWAKEVGVTGGNGPDTFGPGSDCTRAQIVTFLYRYFVK